MTALFMILFILSSSTIWLYILENKELKAKLLELDKAHVNFRKRIGK